MGTVSMEERVVVQNEIAAVAVLIALKLPAFAGAMVFCFLWTRFFRLFSRSATGKRQASIIATAIGMLLFVILPALARGSIVGYLPPPLYLVFYFVALSMILVFDLRNKKGE